MPFGHATRFFRIDNGIIKVCLCFIDSQNTYLTQLDLRMNKIGDAGASGLGAGLAYVSFCLCGWMFIPTPRHPIFHIDNGIVKVCVRLFCSQNNTLQALVLESNKIGDAGAASIGVALAYVMHLPVEWAFIPKDISLAPPDFSDW